MPKLIGALIVFLSSLAIGAAKTQNLKSREKMLASLEVALIALEGEIEALRPLPAALISAGAADKSAIMKKAAANMGDGGAAQGWERAVYECKSPALVKKDKELLASFGAGLESPDKNGQLMNIALFKKRLSRAAKEAAERSARLGRLYITAGGLCGAAAVIMLI